MEKEKDLLEKEYEESFTGEEKILHTFSNLRSDINTYMKEIPIEDILTTNFKKISRTKTVKGLTGVVAEWGVVTPIHVLALEDDETFQLLDGLRRIYSALRSGREKIEAVVWDFSDKTEGKELSNVLSLMVNRTEQFSPKEMWEQMKILETVNHANPGLVEYLLQMYPGDAMKLKDIMLSEPAYEEAKEELLSGKLNIEKAYRKLNNLRKKEDKLSKEDKMSVDEEGLKKQNPESNKPMSEMEVKELLEITNEDVTDKNLEDLNKTNEIRKNDMHQETGNRHYVEKSIKTATLIRDDNHCRCCGIGGSAWTGILVYHHLIPVYLGGPDTVDNGLTMCVNCHLTLHNYITGDIQVDLETLEEEEKETFKNIFKYGNVAIEAANAKGMKRKKIKEADKPSKQHPMPNANVEMNKEALSKSISG